MSDTVKNKKDELIRNTIISRGIEDNNVIEAFYKVPREYFVPEKYKSFAYSDSPIPIGRGQTISQPYIVALMLEQLELEPDDKVLEIGSGSGYVLALLSEIVSSVVGIELESILVENSRKSLENAGYDRDVEVIHTDASSDLREYFKEEEFDKILASASPEDIPVSWENILKEDGILVLPIQGEYFQSLVKYRKKEGKLEYDKDISEVRFVPLRKGN